MAVDENGVYTFNSWDGKTGEDGLFGIWNKPDNFTGFTYAWIVPEHFEILDYESNRAGTWVERRNTVSFYGNDVNSLTFTIRYRERDSDKDGVADRSDRCPGTAIGSEFDSDPTRGGQVSHRFRQAD